MATVRHRLPDLGDWCSRTYVRFTPKSGQTADSSICPLCAISDRTQRSKIRAYFDRLAGCDEQFVGHGQAEHSASLGSRLFLWNERLSRRPDSRDFNYHLPVLSP